MSDKFLSIDERYAARQEARFRNTVERARRRQRIAQLEAERAELKNVMEETGPVDFAKQFLYSTVAGGVQDALKSANTKAAEVAGWAAERVLVPGERLAQSLGAGEPAVSAQQVGDTITEKANVMDRFESIPTMSSEDSSKAARVTEGLARSLVSFFSLYGPAVKMIGRTGQSRMASDIYAGTVADMWAFENKQGTFADLARDVGVADEVVGFYSGELSENEFEASLKAGMEGAAIGSAFYGIAKVYRILRDGYGRFNKPTEVAE